MKVTLQWPDGHSKTYQITADGNRGPEMYENIFTDAVRRGDAKAVGSTPADAKPKPKPAKKRAAKKK